MNVHCCSSVVGRRNVVSCEALWHTYRSPLANEYECAVLCARWANYCC